MSKKVSLWLRMFGLSLLLFTGLHSYAQVIPPKPNPPRLVNDMANMMTAGEQNQLERELVDFSRQTSNEITIITIDSLGDYDVSDYAIKLGNAWGIGRKEKDNGVVILASLKDHKINISTGKGLEGALTDLQCGRIIRNEIVPSFRDKNYYEGFSKAAAAVIAVTKGEYKGEGAQKSGHIPVTAIIILVIIVFFIIRMIGGGGSGGGNYMSGGGLGNFATGMFLGSMLGGRGDGGGGFGGGGGGGGFGGFGGGGFGGGGASGSW